MGHSGPLTLLAHAVDEQARIDMSLYSVDKLITETRRLAAEFRRTTGTMLPVSGEIARYEVSHHLNLSPTEEPIAGVDAIANDVREGQRVQIKSRVIEESIKSGHRVGQFSLDADWDFVVLSLMDAEFEPFEMYALSHQDVAEATTGNNGKRSKRGALSVAKFRIIGHLVWTPECGIERDVWNDLELF